MARAVHAARRLRQAGDLDGAMAAFAELDPAGASEAEARWAYGEWVGPGAAALRGQRGRRVQPGHGTGRRPRPSDSEDGMLEVLTVLGMRWQPGQRVSRRSLRGLRPLAGGAS